MTLQSKITEMMLRPEGASKAELLELTGWKYIAVKLYADRAGLRLIEEAQSDGSVRYRGVRPSVKVLDRAEMPMAEKAKEMKDERRFWTKKEVTYLRWAASKQIGTNKIAAHLRRSEIAVRQKAFDLDLSLETRQSMVEPKAKVEPKAEAKTEPNDVSVSVHYVEPELMDEDSHGLGFMIGDDSHIFINVNRKMFGDVSPNAFAWLARLSPKQTIQLAQSLLSYALEQAENRVQRKRERKAARAEQYKAKPTAEVIPLTTRKAS